MYEDQQENMYEPQPIPQGEMGGHSAPSSIKFQLEFSELIDEISHNLKSEIPVRNIRTGELEWKTPTNITPLINGKGVNNVIITLQSHLSKVFILSNLEEKTIENMTIELGRNLIDDLYYNWNVYGIKDTAAASTIVSIVCNSVFATLRKSHQGKYLMFLSKTTQANEVQHYMQRPQAQQNNDSIIGKLFKKRR